MLQVIVSVHVLNVSHDWQLNENCTMYEETQSSLHLHLSAPSCLWECTAF